jgi:hypothetical protein
VSLPGTPGACLADPVIAPPQFMAKGVAVEAKSRVR